MGTLNDSLSLRERARVRESPTFSWIPALAGMTSSFSLYLNDMEIWSRGYKFSSFFISSWRAILVRSLRNFLYWRVSITSAALRTVSLAMAI